MRSLHLNHVCTVLSILFICLFSRASNGQDATICGYFPPTMLDSSQWDFILYDRFGNAYTVEDMLIDSRNSSSSCSDAGFFDLEFVGSFTIYEIETICQAFSDLSEEITSIQNDILIKIEKTSLEGGDLGAASSLFLTDTYLGSCGVAAPLLWERINTDADYAGLLPLNLAMGVVKIANSLPSGTNWHTLNEDNSPSDPSVDNNEYDLYTTALHEALHLLGFGSRISLDGTPINGFYSTWDKFLYGSLDNDFLIIPENSEDCCDYHEFNTIDFPQLPDDIINSCSQNQNYNDIVFNSNSTATINADYGFPTDDKTLVNILSHLDKDCDQVPYVMHYKLVTGENRRSITDPEKTILCDLGYLVNDVEIECDACTIMAVDDGPFLPNNPLLSNIYITVEDLIGNDLLPEEYTIEILTDCGDAALYEIVVDYDGSTDIILGWFITQVQQYGELHRICYNLIGCDGDCDQGIIYIQKINVPPVDLLPSCPEITDCNSGNLFCYGDFEAFPTNSENQAYVYSLSLGLTACNPEYPGLQNSPDILIENGPNQLIRIYSFRGRTESEIVPLSQPIQPGCTAFLSFDTRLDDGDDSPAIVDVYASNQNPCSLTDIPDCPGTNDPGTFFCILDDITVDYSEWQSNGPFSWENLTDEPINYLLITNNPEHSSKLFVDNIVVTSECDNQLQITSSVLSACIDGIAQIEYVVCMTGSDNTATDITLEMSMPPLPGIDIGNSDFQNGTEIISGLLPGHCETLTLELNIGAVYSQGTEFLINIDVTAPNTCITESSGMETLIFLQECPFEDFICPCEINGRNIGNPYSETTLSYLIDNNIMPNTSLDNDQHCLAISGRLIIDLDYIIDGGDIKMQPGSEIVIPNGSKLVISNLELFGCEQMWRSITVEPGGNLMLEHNVIQDAQYAVQASSNDLFTSTLDVWDNVFDRNHVGILISNSSLQSILQTYPLRENTFNCTDDLISSFDIIENYDQENSFAGIETHNAIFTVGGKQISPHDIFINIFRNLRNGIVAENSTLAVYSAKFRDLIGNPDLNPTILNTKGTGIFSSHGLISAQKNEFTTLSRAFNCKNSDIIASKNNIHNNVNVGFHILSPNFNFVYIENNEIEFKEYGIHILYGESPLKIALNSNIISLEDAEPIFGIKAAIRSNGGLPNALEDAHINNNIITSTNPMWAINIGSQGNWEISNNNIDFLSWSTNGKVLDGGINLEKSDQNYIFNNTINSDNEAYNIAALLIHSSEENVFCCNSTDGTRYGAWFSGYSYNTSLRHTEFGDHFAGLACGRGTSLGDQENGRNEWNGSFSAWSARHAGSLQEISASEFKVELPKSQPFWPPNPSSPNSSAWFNPSGSNGVSCSADNTICPVPPDFPIITPVISDTDIKISRGSLLSSEYGVTTAFEGQRSIFKKIMDHEVLFGQVYSVDSFFQNSQLIEKLYNVDSKTRWMWNIPENFKTKLIASSFEIDSIIKEILDLDSLMIDADDYSDTLLLSNERADLIITLESINKLYFSINDALVNLQRAKIPIVINSNQQIVPSTNLDSNLVAINDIYLQTIGNDIFTLSTPQLNIVSKVAWQCPLIGGDVVYTARQIYYLEFPNTYFYDDSLCNQIGERNIINAIEDKYYDGEDIQIFPNPATESFSIILPDGAKVEYLQVELINTTGNIVKHDIYLPTNNQITVNINDIINGIYIVSVRWNEQMLPIKKICILNQL